MRFFQALPFAFGDDGIERVDDGGEGFKIFAEGAGKFFRGMIVTQSAAEFEGSGVGAGELRDPLIEMAAVRRNVFTECDEDVAKEYSHAGDRLGVNFAELRVVFRIVEKMDTEFLQQSAEIVFDFDAVEIHGDFEAGDGIGAKENFVVLSDVE